MTGTPIGDAADIAVHGSGPRPIIGAHAASAPRAPQPKATTFGQFLHRLFTIMGEFAADGAPVAERIIADRDFDQALELLLRAHAAGRTADVVALMSDALSHRLDGPQSSFLPAPTDPERGM